MAVGDFWDVGERASYDGTCPICSHYIRGGVSMISPLAVPLPPDPAELYCRAGTFVDKGGAAVRLRRRAWVHAACRTRVDMTEEGLTALAEQRRLKLADMRAESRPPHKTKRGGRR